MDQSDGLDEQQTSQCEVGDSLHLQLIVEHIGWYGRDK